MILRSYDGRAAQPRYLLPNVPTKLDGKIVLIEREVFNSNIEYNLLLGRSYMYAMKVVSFPVF